MARCRTDLVVHPVAHAHFILPRTLLAIGGVRYDVEADVSVLTLRQRPTEVDLHHRVGARDVAVMLDVAARSLRRLGH